MKSLDRLKTGVLAAFVAPILISLPSVAQDIVEPAATSASTSAVPATAKDADAPPAAAAPPSEVATTAIVAIRAQLSGEGGPKLNAASKTALKAFYGAEDREPLWIDDSGLTDKATALLKELGNADDYGLDAKAYAIAGLNDALSTEEQRATAEIKITNAVLLYARHAQGGRLSRQQAGSQLTHTPVVSPAEDILGKLAEQDDPAFFLRSLHPVHPQFAALRARLKEARGGDGKQAGPKIPDGPVLRVGVAHAQVKLLRQRLGLLKAGDNEQDEKAKTFDDALKQAVMAFQKKSGLAEDGVVGGGTRKVLNGQSPERLITKLLINMERWRWLPDDLDGAANIYVWANIPELRVRIVQSGKTVF
ncbi:MAG: peptidoglycan-binding protein, partial [Pseudomonadota bacterium]